MLRTGFQSTLLSKGFLTKILYHYTFIISPMIVSTVQSPCVHDIKW